MTDKLRWRHLVLILGLLAGGIGHAPGPSASADAPAGAPGTPLPESAHAARDHPVKEGLLNRESAAEIGGDDITAAALGDFYDMSDGVPPIQKGGPYKSPVSGDTWYSTWAADDTAYVTMDDGWGFDNVGGENARHRLCRLDGNPNLSTDSFRGVNLNPGLLGKTIPHHQTTPEWRIGYSSSVAEFDGVLYVVRHNWSPQDSLWPPIDSSIVKSSDGGKTWTDHLGRVNADLPGKDDAMFPRLPWSWFTFVQYGKGGAAPDVDGARRYVYLTASGGYLARVGRARLPRLNKNDFQYYRGGKLDGGLDASWSQSPDDAGPMRSIDPLRAPGKDLESPFNLATVFYNAAMKRYVGLHGDKYMPAGQTGHDHGKTRIMIYVARHPWGPWRKILNYGIWGIAGWDQLLCNKFTTRDGLKMWFTFCGEYKGDTWNYGFQYSPVYLSTGAVDVYEAEKASRKALRVGSTYPSFSGSGYVEGFAKAGDGVAFAVEKVNGAGWHIVRIRYTSPRINAGTLSVYVNGAKARRVRLSQNNSDCDAAHHWTDRSDIYWLNDGANTFEIRQDEGDDGAGVLIDSIAVSRERTHDEGRNVAPEATATASSGDPRGAADGCVDALKEWTAAGTKGEWIRLDWGRARTIDKVVLYDRANATDQVTAGTLSFSDGTSVKVGKLQNDGAAGTVVTFEPRKVTWLRFAVDGVREGTRQCGLGEIQVHAGERKP